MGFFNDLKEDLANTVNEVTEEAVAKELANSEEIIKQDFATFQKEEKLKPENKASLELEIQNILNGIEDTTTPEEYLINEEEVDIEVEMEMDDDAIDNLIDTLELSNESKGINLMIEPAEEHIIQESYQEEETITEEINEAEVVIEEEQEEIVRTIDEDTVVISPGTCINGDIDSTSFFDVRGKIKGNIDVKNNIIVSGEVVGDIRAREVYIEGAIIRGNIISDRTVQISEKSVIIGELRAEAAFIAGAVKGNIDITNSVILDSTAKVLGDINCKLVQINNGAVLEGKCSQTYSDVTPSAFFENY